MFTPQEIGSRIVSDNEKNEHCTADPIFVVQERKRIYGMDPDLDDIPIAWMYSDGGEIPDEDAKIAEAYWQEHLKEPCGVEDGTAWCNEGRDTLNRVAYLDTWEFVQPFFTQAAADRYIEENRHRMKDPQVYVDSAYRNREWQGVRKMLADFAPEAQYPWCCLSCHKSSGQPRSRMIVCSACGNKRCPKATDHNNACTDSNEPRQAGSAFQAVV